MNKEIRENWVRTGKTIQELSVTGGGIVTLAEEKYKNKTRLVAIAYSTIVKKANDE